MPSLLKLLQHPMEARRAFAAEYAALLGSQASSVVISELLSSSSGLSTLLTRLSGDDKPQSRAYYASLIACCPGHSKCTPAVLKQISDSGAVPYLLKLLTEADGAGKYRVVACLEVCSPLPCEEPVGVFMKQLHAHHNFGPIFSLTALYWEQFLMGPDLLLCPHWLIVKRLLLAVDGHRVSQEHKRTTFVCCRAWVEPAMTS